MADSLARAQLARAADTFRCAAGSLLPAMVLMTDDERLPDLRATVLALPRDSLVVLRSREEERRIALAGLIAGLAPRRGIKWLVADDPGLAVRMGANGAHFPESKFALAARWRVCRPDWIITCAAHSLHALFRAKLVGASAALLSPIFPTMSHPGSGSLGSIRARSIASAAQLPVYALGGVDARTARQLAGGLFVGIAAISGLAVRFRDAGRCACDRVNV